jgi:hypothetical protein
VLHARLRQEIGDFIPGAKALEEMKQVLSDKGDSVLSQINPERVVYYWAKYYHVQAKNLARQLY